MRVGMQTGWCQHRASKDSGFNTQQETGRVLFLKEKTNAAVGAGNGSTNPVYHTKEENMISLSLSHAQTQRYGGSLHAKGGVGGYVMSYGIVSLNDMVQCLVHTIDITEEHNKLQKKT